MSASRAYLLGVALASASGLMYQQLLARLFSATMHYHFAFLALSVAMLGSGLGGLAARAALPEERRRARLVWAAALAALAVAASVWLILEGAVEYELDATGYARLARAYLAAAVPLGLIGYLLALALLGRTAEAGRVYRADLAGAGAGSALALPVVGALGAIDGLLLVAALTAAAGAAFAATAPRPRLTWPLATVAALAALALGNHRGHWISIRVDRSGDASEALWFSAWNSYSRVTVRQSDPGGDLLLAIDADAASPIFRDAVRLERHRHRARDLVALPHRLRPARDVLVIGPGGGSEVVAARLFGPDRIVACELNPLVGRALEQPDVVEFTGGPLYRQPGVELVIDEGRHYARRCPGAFDLVQVAMVDTWAATASGAFSLAENHLYTVEGVSELLGALRPDGVLALTRWQVEPPDQLLRLAALTRAAVERRGQGPATERILIATEPAQHGRARVLLMACPSPFSAPALDAFDAAVAELGLEALYSPRRADQGPLAYILGAADLEATCQAAAADILPPTDDRPFFFHTLRLTHWRHALDHSWEWRKSNAGLLSLLAAIAVALMGLLALGLAALARPGRGDRFSALLLFAALGAAFIVAEVALVERLVLLLGHPSYALSVALACLLAWSAAGSGAAARADPRRALGPALLASAGACLAAALCLGPAIHLLLDAPRPARIALALAGLAPIGLALGRPFPLALRRLGEAAPAALPWAWAANGLAGVAGGALAVTVAIAAGFAATFTLAAALYAIALVASRTGPFR